LGKVENAGNSYAFGIEALGLRLVAARPADGMTAAFIPEGIDGKHYSTGCTSDLA